MFKYIPIPIPITRGLIGCGGLKPHGRKSIFLPLLHLWPFLGTGNNMAFFSRPAYAPIIFCIGRTRPRTIRRHLRCRRLFPPIFLSEKYKIHFASQAGFTSKLKKKFKLKYRRLEILADWSLEILADRTVKVDLTG
jgi:hypothetical protein